MSIVKYQVFIRNWYRKDHRGHLVPCPGKKKVIRNGLTIDEARRLCNEYNSSNDPDHYQEKQNLPVFKPHKNGINNTSRSTERVRSTSR